MRSKRYASFDAALADAAAMRQTGAKCEVVRIVRMIADHPAAMHETLFSGAVNPKRTPANYRQMVEFKIRRIA